MAIPLSPRGRIPADLAAAARARVQALAVPEGTAPADGDRSPAGPAARPGDEPVLVTDAPPWPTSSAPPEMRAGDGAGEPVEDALGQGAADPGGPPDPPDPPGGSAGHSPGGTAAGPPGGAAPAAPRGGRRRARSGRRPVLAAAGDLLPPAVRSGRLAVDGRAAVSVAVVVLLAAALGGTYLWRARPTGAALPPPAVSTPATPSPTATGAAVVIDVQGLVRRPGVVRLPAGSRVQDALRAAGGTARGAGTASLNLARVLADGEQLVVTRPGVAPPPPGPGQPGPAGPAGAVPGGGQAGSAVVDLNTATLDQLDALPGVGPVLAQRILDWRAEHGRFSSVEELREVNGIGERRFADLEKRVRV